MIQKVVWNQLYVNSATCLEGKMEVTIMVKVSGRSRKQQMCFVVFSFSRWLLQNTFDKPTSIEMVWIPKNQWWFWSNFQVFLCRSVICKHPGCTFGSGETFVFCYRQKHCGKDNWGYIIWSRGRRWTIVKRPCTVIV